MIENSSLNCQMNIVGVEGGFLRSSALSPVRKIANRAEKLPFLNSTILLVEQFPGSFVRFRRILSGVFFES